MAAVVGVDVAPFKAMAVAVIIAMAAAMGLTTPAPAPTPASEPVGVVRPMAGGIQATVAGPVVVLLRRG